MKVMLSNAQAPLLRAIQHVLVKALTYDLGRSTAIIVEAAVSEEWASATFVGERHRLELRLEPNFASGTAAGQDASNDGSLSGLPACAAVMNTMAELAMRMPEVEIEIPGHFVADMVVIGLSQHNNAVHLTLEALTLLDD